jgi:hypothetical protein
MRLNNRLQVSFQPQAGLPRTRGAIPLIPGPPDPLIPGPTIGALKPKVRHNKPVSLTRLSDISTWQDRRMNDRVVHFR